MKTIIISALFLMIANCAFAQKVYVDPNVRTKKGLLDPGQSPVIASDKKEAIVEGSAISTENDPIKKRYCACFNSQRLSEQRNDLAQKLHSNNVISWEEFKAMDYSDDVRRRSSLLKKYTLSIDIETDDIECDLVEVSAKKPKDFKKPLEALDSVCKFDEIDRKKI